MATTLATLKLKVEANTRDLDKFKRALGQTKKQSDSLRKSAFSLRGAMVALAGAAGMAYAAKKVFDLGSAVEETASKFNTVFGPAAESVQGFIDDFAVMAGLSTEAAQEITATTGAIVQGMGFAQVASAAFAEALVRVAGDLSSFNNIPVAATARAIQAAITGERESMKRLGIVILETDVQMRGLEMTGKANAKALTQQERAAATLALITERAGVAMGDLVRTQGSAANVARRLGARWQNLKEQVATGLLPVMAQLLSAFDEQTTNTETLEERIKSTTKTLEELIINVELGVLAFGVINAKLNLFFAKADAFQRMKEFFDKDLPDSVRITEIALNNMSVKAAERTEVLLLRLNRLRSDGIEPVAVSAKTAAQTLQEMGIAATLTAGQARTMQHAVVDADVGMDIVMTATRQATMALRSYNEEASTASKLSGILGKGLIVAGLLGLAPVSGIISKGLGFLGLFDHGGSIPSGGVGIVGEKGPELVRGPAHVTSRADTAALGGDVVVNIVIEQEGIEVRRITARQRRDANLGLTHRLALPAPAVG